jgi:hypothetical protein
LALEQPPGQGVVLAHERPGAGGGLALADQERGVVFVPGGGQLGLVEVIEGAVGRQGGVCQVLHLPLGIGGLGGPAPLAGRAGVDDGLQLAQGVCVAQGMRG